MELWLDKVPVREEKMTPYEIMLSESQERMLLVAKKGDEKKLEKIFKKWELEFAVVGEVITEEVVVGKFHGEEVFKLPVSAVTDEAPLYHRPVKEPSPASRKAAPESGFPEGMSNRWVYRQYDSMVGTNTVFGPGEGSAAVVRIKENGRLLAITLHSNAGRCKEDPYQGSYETVMESAEKIRAVGAEPIGVSDCLNFGNPENPEVMWEIQESCRGIADACKKLEIPVVSGNVSLYNETEGKSIYPTPVIAMVGLLPKGAKVERKEKCAA